MVKEYSQWFKDGYNYAHKEIVDMTTPYETLEALCYSANDDFDRGIAEALRDHDDIVQGKKGLMK